MSLVYNCAQEDVFQGTVNSYNRILLIHQPNKRSYVQKTVLVTVTLHSEGGFGMNKKCSLIGLFFLVTLLMFPGAAFSQDSQELASDDFESYDTGAGLPDDDPIWTTWNEDQAVDGTIVETQANSGVKSLQIEDGNDVVALLNLTEGIIVLSAVVYVPTDHVNQMHFIILNQYDPGAGSYSWALQLDLDATAGTITGPDSSSLPLVVDDWAEIKIIIDLNLNQQDIYYDGALLVENTVFAPNNVVALAAVDLYADAGSTPAFIDDVYVGMATSVAPEFGAAPDADAAFAPGDYTITLPVTGVPAPDITVLPEGAVYENGTFTYTIPDPAPASFTVSLTATNENGTAEVSWDVTVEKLIAGELSEAGELFVDITADDASAGEAVWVNNGTLMDFDKVGEPYVTDFFGPPAVSFNNDATNDAYQCQEQAPAGLVGLDPTRSIEIWVLNEVLQAEDTMVSWGHRGGPAGANMGFHYGENDVYGAVGHWGAPDLGWKRDPAVDQAPEGGTWHHLVYTYDGTTTRVYSDGAEKNSEELGAGAINTNAGTPITLGAEVADAAGNPAWGAQAGSLYIGRVRVHDEVLAPEKIAHNYNVLKDYYKLPLAPPVISNARTEDFYIEGDATYTWTVGATGYPEPELTLIEPVDALLAADGTITYDLSVQPESFTVTIQATNSEGQDEVSWVVTRRPLPQPENLEVAGRLLVWLDANQESAGTELWENLGTIREFFLAAGEPVYEQVAGVNAVTFDGQTAYQSIDPTPAEIVGLHPTHTVEAWVFNPEIADEETVVSWSRRGGPCGTNMSFNYGSNGTFGAIGHWCDSDIGWGPEVPAAGKWHHLAYTYNGSETDTPTTNIYIDGALTNTENIELNAHPDTRISIAAQLEGDGVTLNTALMGTLSINKLRIHSEALTEAQVLANYEEEVPEFAKVVLTGVPADDFVYTGSGQYAYQLSFTGAEPIAFEVLEPAGAAVDAAGLITYPLPDPEPESFVVHVQATNDYNTDEASWTVQVVSPSMLAQEPVHHYPFETDATDVIGGADGLAYGPVSFQGGMAVLGNDGSQTSNAQGLFPDPADPEKPAPGAYIDLPDTIISVLGQQATFEAWVGWNGPAGSSWQRIFDLGTSEAGEDSSPSGALTNYLFITPRSSANTLRFGVNFGTLNNAQNERVIDSTPLPADGTLQHVALVWDETRTSAQLFHNGKLVAEDLNTHMTLSDLTDVNNWLGRAQWNDAMFNGSYADFRIYGYALSKAEVLGNFNAGPDTVNFLPPGQYLFIGDANCSSMIDISDVICILSHLFGPEGTTCKEPCCKAGMNVNADESVDIADAVALLGYLFNGMDMIAPDGTSINAVNAGCAYYLNEDIPLPCDQPCR